MHPIIGTILLGIGIGVCIWISGKLGLFGRHESRLLGEIINSMEGAEWDQAIKDLNWMVHVRLPELRSIAAQYKSPQHAINPRRSMHAEFDYEDQAHQIRTLLRDLHAEMSAYKGFQRPDLTKLEISKHLILLLSYRK